MTCHGYYQIGNNESIISSKNSNKFIDTINYIKSTTVLSISLCQFPHLEVISAFLGLLNSYKSIICVIHRQKLFSCVVPKQKPGQSRKKRAIDSKIVSTCTPDVGIWLLVSSMKNGLCKHYVQ